MAVSGAITDRDKYSELFLRVTRVAGFLVPLVAAGYGIAIMQGVAQPSPIYNATALWFILVAFVTLGVIQYIVKPSKPASLGVFITLYHIMACIYLIYGPGLISPIAFTWIILTVITEIFYGRFAGMLSLLLVTSTGFLIYLFEPTPDSTGNVDYIFYIAIIAVSSILLIHLRSVQTVEHQDLKRTRTKEQLQRGQLVTLINSLNAAIISTSSSGTVRIYNAALLNLLDTNRSLSGKNIDGVLNLYDAKGEPVSIIDLTAKSKKIVERDDLMHRFDDGEEIRLNISCAPIRGKFAEGSKQYEGYIFILRDITQEKSLEEERNEFISVVSHELRTPITIAEGTISNLQLLLDREDDPTKLSPALKEAHEQIIYLASMVNDLSTLSRAERGVADEPEEVDVKLLLEELYRRYQPKAAEKQLKLDLDVGHKLSTIFVSRLYIEEILQNFLTNAIKYTQTGTVTLHAKRTKDEVLFSVSDTGIGISKSEQKRVFEKFYRSEDYRTRETSGTGLGLYVVNKLADKLGIDIKVESRLNHGSTFSFVLHDEKESQSEDETLTKQGQ